MLTSLLMLIGTQAALATRPDPQQLARRDKLRMALVVRDKAPPCTELSAMSDALVTDLQWLMDHVTAPPWVGIRAAQCILQLHGTQEADRIEDWVQDPDKPGLVLVVLGELDEIPAPIATTIVQAALSGPHAARVLPRLSKSAHPQVRALLRSESTER